MRHNNQHSGRTSMTACTEFTFPMSALVRLPAGCGSPCRGGSSCAPRAAGAVAAPALAAGVSRHRARRAAAAGAAAPGRPILIKGGCVLSLDRAVGDFEQADVLIEGGKISAVRPNISAANAEVIDASNTIVMPGFVDTHRHMWQGILRNVLPDGSLEDYIQRGAAHVRRRLHAGRCLCGRPAQRARRDRHRRDLRARLVAHPQHARAHRRGHQGACGIRRARGVRLRQSAERHPANGRTRRATSIPTTSRACASSTSPAKTS